jgi:hypothetical protein
MAARLDAADARIANLEKIVHKVADKAGFILMDQPAADSPKPKPKAEPESKSASAPSLMGEVGRDKLGAVKTAVDISAVITGSPVRDPNADRRQTLKSILARVSQ